MSLSSNCPACAAETIAVSHLRQTSVPEYTGCRSPIPGSEHHAEYAATESAAPERQKRHNTVIGLFQLSCVEAVCAGLVNLYVTRFEARMLRRPTLASADLLTGSLRRVSSRCSGQAPNELPYDPTPEIGPIRRQRFLGGLLRHYYRVAA